MDSKAVYKSRTVWVNSITAVVAVVGALAGQDFIASNPAAVAVAGAVLGVANVVLRLVTDKAITWFEE